MVPSPSSTKSARDAFARAVRSVAPGDRSLGLEVGQEGEMQAAGRRRPDSSRPDRTRGSPAARRSRATVWSGVELRVNPGSLMPGFRMPGARPAGAVDDVPLLTLRSPIGLRHVVGLRQERRHAPRRGDGLPEWQILRRSEWGRGGDRVTSHPSDRGGGTAGGRGRPRIPRDWPRVRPHPSPACLPGSGHPPHPHRRMGIHPARRGPAARPTRSGARPLGKPPLYTLASVLLAASTAGHRRERALTDM